MLNLLNIIKLSYLNNKNILMLSNYHYNKNLLNLLLKINYIKNFFLIKNTLIIVLNKKKIKKININYKPSNYLYLNYNDLKKLVKKKNTIFVLSTTFGLLTHYDALSKKCGGKLLFSIF